MLIERRFQPVWILALGLLMTVSLGVAYGSVLIPIIGWVAGVGTTIPVVWLWLRGRTDIRMDEQSLYVGRYQLETEYVGDVLELDANQFLQRIRGGASQNELISIPNPKFGGIVISNLDETDPYRYWVLSSKNPKQTAAAIRAVLTSTVN